jgi:CRISPR type IV-associated protein Csf3
MFEPLRITAHLQTGVVSDVHLPLDAVLYYQHIRERYGEQTMSVPGRSMVPDDPGGHALPIQKLNRDCDAWYYAASFAQWPEHTVFGTEHWSKRFRSNLSDLVDFGKAKAKVNTARGEYKGNRTPVFYFHALYVQWFIVGDKERIERLLRFCTNLGKKVSQGWGAVLSWEVESWPDDWSVYSGTGKLMRAIPKDGGILYGIRPSYWLSRHQFECQLPQ